ncbi:hypothetical protein SB719_21375, partial [Pantoea sp. SIMBA_079]|uniref:hypothetical protein n=1 Tax=Pantoea sp. SIMBA_079 TaxID=3085817 RepID=UPI0039935F4E
QIGALNFSFQSIILSILVLLRSDYAPSADFKLRQVRDLCPFGAEAAFLGAKPAYFASNFVATNG